MPYEVVMPRLGWNMEKGSLGGWLKQDGDPVEMGEIIFTVEGDKATQEVEALESGILCIPQDSPPPNVEVPVGTLLAYILQPGESLPRPPKSGESVTLSRAGGQAPAFQAASEASRVGEPGSAPSEAPRNRISPRARRVAGELGVDWTALRGSGRAGRIVERDVRQAAEAARAVERVSPLARRLAAELGVDVDRLAATLPGKRIERADVEAAARAGISAVVAPTPGGPARQPAEVVVPITAVRRAIAERMAASAHTAAPVTLTTEADATELVRLRAQLQEDGRGPVPSYTDLLVKLVAAALAEHPLLNARLDGDVIRQSAVANIGIAVDTERGLLAPVLRDVAGKSLRQIAQESAALVERARAGRLTADELTGGTFTITNLGMYEIDAFTPIINLPECAVLGVGRIVPKQVVIDAAAERVAIRRMVFLSLTFDHRLVDGAPAARFLQRVKQYVERPYLWLVG
jgi:pyruvate dehydrogenase E2 component (dihydrolipoamide acetyltransferase)